MEKPKIYFIPPLISTLKHYERLIPYLKNTYDIGFLILIRDPVRRTEVHDYCKSKKYDYYLMDERLSEKRLIHIPIVSVLKQRYNESVAYRKFLEAVKPAKVICHKAAHPYDSILKEANQKGIETIILQVSTEKNFQQRPPHADTPNRSWELHRFLLQILSAVLDFLDVFRREKRFGLTPAMPKKIGVFGKEEARSWIAKGYDPRIVHVVGSIDFQSVHELKQKIDTDVVLKEKLLEKYGLSRNKLNIVVVLFRFYMNLSKEDAMTIPEHVAHNYEVFRILREVFSQEEADIVLRMAPTENHMPLIYEPYKKLNVTLCYGPQTHTDEIVCLADLYVAEPLTSVNNILLASNSPSIFFNFSKLQFFNDSAGYFHIKRVMTDKETFKTALKNFKNGTLEKQYDNSGINLKSADSTVKLISS